MTTRGLPSIRRVHAKNYIREEADKRLKEVVEPYRQQGMNALGVDSHEVLLFLKKPSTIVCTCREIQTETEIGTADSTIVVSPRSVSDPVSGGDVTFDWRRPLFGEPNEARIEENDGTSIDDYEFDDSPVVPHANQIFESSPDCAVCYRSGFIPGFELVGKHRILLTTKHVAAHQSYTIDRTRGPHVFERLDRNGWIEFEVRVPKYFKSVSYSIRNNNDVLDNMLTLAGGALTLDALRALEGQTVRLRVTAEEFTHVVLTFDMGTEPIRANIAQLSRQTDWTKFAAISNLNVILPMTVPDMPTGSLIVVPKLNLVLNIMDVTYLRTVDSNNPAQPGSNNLDWSVNTRVSQPQEPVVKIHKGFPIL